MTILPNRFLPRPRLSLALLVMWLLLQNSLTFPAIFFGAILGWLIPLMTHQLWPEEYRPMKYFLFFRFALVVLRDIILASAHVAYLILGPSRKLHPAFVTYPLELENEFTITVLANTISLTPGTVSANISRDKKYLLIHALDVEDEQELISSIKKHYEKPLREIFE